jgi:TPP-dependent pyruvate/acetoin dehydrogenase alpha subunit
LWDEELGAMGVTDGGKTKGGATKTVKQEAVFENPLVPNKLLREMYEKMVELRLLDGWVSRQAKKAKVRLPSTAGQEACRVSVLKGLGAGDVVMDAQAGLATAHLRGAKLGGLLNDARAVFAGDRRRDAEMAKGQMPWMKDVEARLFAAVGAAQLMKAEGRTNTVVVYAGAEEAGAAVWRRVLGFAARHELPVIFVVMGRTGAKKGAAKLSALAVARGVPGIPVEESDVIALYRVAQESLGRIRAGGGPVLIECIAYEVAGAKAGAAKADAIGQLGEYLVGRRIGTKAWVEGVGRRFEAKLEAEAKG